MDIKINDYSEFEFETYFQQYPLLMKYKDVFPKELPRMPPTKKLKFLIDLVPGVELVSRVPY